MSGTVRGVIVIAALIGIIVTIVYAADLDSDEDSTQSTTASRDAGSKGEGECKKAIESMARYDYDWTTGFLESAFYLTSDVNAEGRVTRWGNKVKFQNGFGAWSRGSYWCTYDLDTKRVVDVEVQFPD